MKLRFLTTVLSLFLLSCSDSGTSPAIEGEVVTITSGGRTRTFKIRMPNNADSGQLPAVIAFHGAGDTGENFQIGADIDRFADQYSMIMVYPSAEGFNWAEGIGARADTAGIDDVGFTRDMIDYLAENNNLDRNRVYAVGFSQGGLFSHRLVCDMPEAIAAYATVASTMSVIVAQRCTTAINIPGLLIHGTNDPIFSPFGNKDIGIFSFLSQREIVNKLVFSNSAVDSTITNLPNTANDGVVIRKESHTNVQGQSVVEYYSAEGGGHDWHLGDINTQDTILSFFSNFSKN